MTEHAGLPSGPSFTLSEVLAPSYPRCTGRIQLGVADLPLADNECERVVSGGGVLNAFSLHCGRSALCNKTELKRKLETEPESIWQPHTSCFSISKVHGHDLHIIGDRGLPGILRCSRTSEWQHDHPPVVLLQCLPCARCAQSQSRKHQRNCAL